MSKLRNRRVLITGAARGIGAALARRLHSCGAKVALAGIEPELMQQVAAECGDAPWQACDVRDADATQQAINALAEELGGLDVVVANAGIARQLPLIGGDPEVMEQMIRVNFLGTYHTLRAAGPHIAHADGYALSIASMAAAVHLPLLGAYSASKAAVEALGDTLRIELHSSGARVGVAYFAELDTDMTRRGFGTEAARVLTGGGSLSPVTPLKTGIDALENGIARRSRQIVAPRWAAPLLPVRMLAQHAIDIFGRRKLDEALRVARTEDAGYTTDLPDENKP